MESLFCVTVSKEICTNCLHIKKSWRENQEATCHEESTERVEGGQYTQNIIF